MDVSAARDVTDELGGQQLGGREVHGDRQRFAAATSVDRGEVPAALRQRRMTDPGEQAHVGRDADPQLGVDDASRRVVPSEQRLGADDATVGQ